MQLKFSEKEATKIIEMYLLNKNIKIEKNVWTELEEDGTIGFYADTALTLLLRGQHNG